MGKEIIVYQQNNYALQFQYLYEDDTPKDVSGKTLKFVVKECNDYLKTDVRAILKKVQVLPNNTESQNGIFYVSLDYDDTKNLFAGVYKYQVELITGDNDDVFTIWEDAFIVKENIIKE